MGLFDISTNVQNWYIDLSDSELESMPEEQFHELLGGTRNKDIRYVCCSILDDFEYLRPDLYHLLGRLSPETRAGFCAFLSSEFSGIDIFAARQAMLLLIRSFPVELAPGLDTDVLIGTYKRTYNAVIYTSTIIDKFRITTYIEAELLKKERNS